MAKKILTPAPKSYTATCGECGTKFSYELEDVRNNYNNNYGVGLPRKFVTCPGENCAAMCIHYDQSI